jgi:hypothetical protein
VDEVGLLGYLTRCCLKILFLKLLGGTKDDVHLKLIKSIKVLDGKEGFMTT